MIIYSYLEHSKPWDYRTKIITRIRQGELENSMDDLCVAIVSEQGRAAGVEFIHLKHILYNWITGKDQTTIISTEKKDWKKLIRHIFTEFQDYYRK